MNNTKSYGELANDCRTWLKDLNFLEDEIMYFQRQLKEVLENNTKVNVTEPAAHFRSHFLLLLDKIRNFKTRINKDEEHLAERMNLAVRMKVEVAEDMHTLKEEVESFFSDYKVAKERYTRFLEEVL